MTRSLNWGLNLGPEASTLPLDYRGGGNNRSIYNTFLQTLGRSLN